MFRLETGAEWFVPIGGFDVHTPASMGGAAGGLAGDAHLIEKRRTRASLRSYRIWDDPTLYLRFAALPAELDDGSWITFANRYGPLRIEWLPVVFSREQGEDDDAQVDRIVSELTPAVARGAPWKFKFIAETRDDWRSEIHMMSLAVAMWREVIESDDPAAGGALGATIGSGLMGRNTRGDGSRPDPDGNTDLVLNHLENGSGAAELVLRPRSLIGGMWMQLADHVLNGARYKRCEVCDNEFAVIPSDQRTMRRKTCSGACRTRLSAQGRPSGG